jgi:hypothetical protein
MTDISGIDPSVPPSGTGCVECLAASGWWVHLRRCAQCGHIGCCDDSPSKQSFEPGEDWFWSYPDNDVVAGPVLAPPDSRPFDQPVPGPAGAVPANWQQLL